MYGFCPLASGSKGNAIFFASRSTRILIDAGLRAKSLFERLSAIDVDPYSLQAILITHEHTDHIAGLAVLAEKLNIPVFANAETAKGIVEILGMRPRFKIFSTGEPFYFGDLEIHPFSIPHDTLDPGRCDTHALRCRNGCGAAYRTFDQSTSHARGDARAIDRELGDMRRLGDGFHHRRFAAAFGLHRAIAGHVVVQ